MSSLENKVNVKSVTGLVDLGFVIPARVKVNAVACVPPEYNVAKPELTLRVDPDIEHDIIPENPAVFLQLLAVDTVSGTSI